MQETNIFGLRVFVLMTSVRREQEHTDMIAELADSATAVVVAAKALGKPGTDPRIKLAHYFDETAAVLLAIVQRKADGMNSVELCANLQLYAERIRDVGKPMIPAEESERLYEALVKAKKSRQMLFITQFVEQHDFDEYTDELSETAVHFRALAKALRESN